MIKNTNQKVDREKYKDKFYVKSIYKTKKTISAEQRNKDLDVINKLVECYQK